MEQVKTLILERCAFAKNGYAFTTLKKCGETETLPSVPYCTYLSISMKSVLLYGLETRLIKILLPKLQMFINSYPRQILNIGQPEVTSKALWRRMKCKPMGLETTNQNHGWDTRGGKIHTSPPGRHSTGFVKVRGTRTDRRCRCTMIELRTIKMGR